MGLATDSFKMVTTMSLLIIIVLATSTTIPAIVMSRVLTGKWFSWTY
jgi:hypothetical protein